MSNLKLKYDLVEDLAEIEKSYMDGKCTIEEMMRLISEYFASYQDKLALIRNDA